MLIPSIDLMGGKIVQLVQGEQPRLSFDDFDYWIERFSSYPLVQLIDLDAAMGQGNNRSLIEMICRRLPCQVGGGLRSPEDGRQLLNIGARRVIYGSSLFGADDPQPAASPFTLSGASLVGDIVDEGLGSVAPAGVPGPFETVARRHKLIRLEFAEELRRALGEDALCFAVDTKNGKVAVRGWKEQVELTPEEAITWLEDFPAAFLYTHVDTEGTLGGFPMDVAAVLRSTTARQLIVAGGLRERRDVEALDAMGVDAVVGMALYAGVMEG